MTRRFGTKSKSGARTRVASIAASVLLLSSIVTTASPAQATTLKARTTGCWSYQFSGFYFPNPVNRISHGTLKARVSLLALGDDGGLYPATITTELISSSGAVVYRSSVDANSARSQDIVVADVTNLAAAFYAVRSTANSDICGTRSISGRIIVS